MDDLVKFLVDQGDNGQYTISKEELLTLRMGGWEELQSAILQYAAEHPNYTITIESLVGGMLHGAVRISWRKNG